MRTNDFHLSQIIKGDYFGWRARMLDAFRFEMSKGVIMVVKRSNKDDRQGMETCRIFFWGGTVRILQAGNAGTGQTVPPFLGLRTFSWRFGFSLENSEFQGYFEPP
jgi:hypothetical protein